MARFVADLGNTRIKWAQVVDTDRLTDWAAIPAHEFESWDSAWENYGARELGRKSRWAISTVNPPIDARFQEFLAGRGVREVKWFRTAAEVPIPHEMKDPHTGGADRALAVAAGRSLVAPGRPGLLVLCGTAITIERITVQGVWQGGVIAPGLGLAARALHLLTAQVPLIDAHESPAAWGRSTQPSVQAGVYWGTVGAVRELLERQKIDIDGDPTILWTGGDAPILGTAIAGPTARIEPDLVLRGLARVAFD
jgi:type III pantothenate kinase